MRQHRQPKLPPGIMDEAVPPQEVTERSGSYYEQERLRAIISEIARRKCESLRLYQPLPIQERFHSSTHLERLLCGSNRGGKTLPAAVEVARAVTSQDPYRKYPKTGLCICVGKDGAHCADPMWRKLARSGAFRIIRDLDTGLWRSSRPCDSSDSQRSRETHLAPPLIPPRFIKSIAWKDRKALQPSKVMLHNGWEIWFRSSEGLPPQGVQADLVWFDEEILHPSWYPELSARLVENEGRFIWSATPQAGTAQLYELHKRAGEGDRLVEEFRILLKDNPYYTDQAKLDFASKLSPEERRVRIEGEYAIVGHLVYPEFSQLIHVCNWFEIPANWTRLLAIDPGRQICAVLFATIPPAGDHVYFYDELYIRQCTAEKLGEALEEKCRTHRFHTFLIDSRAARIHEMGSGVSVEQRYIRQLKKHKLRCTTTGYGFTWAEDDVESGILAFRSWLQTSPNGSPHLRILRGTCPEFENEIQLYHYAKIRGVATDKPLKDKDHLMDCARYIAASDPEYVKPPKRKPPKNWAVKMLAEKRERKRWKEQGGERNHISLGSKLHA